MNRFLKTAVLSLAVAATTLTSFSAANADEWRGRRHYHGGNNDAIAAGVIGLAAGALLGSALAQPRYSQPSYSQPSYDDDYYGGESNYIVRREPIRRPAPVREYYPANYDSYAGGIEPWTPGWYRYCDGRYQSFNARTGTFTGYDGEQHFCVAN